MPKEPKNAAGARAAILLLAPLLALSGACAGTPDKPPAARVAPAPPYAVVIKKGAVFERDHPGFDAKIGGYWLAGDEGALRLDPPAADRPEAPAHDIVLSIRTRPDARGRSGFASARVTTPAHILIVRPDDDSVSIAPFDTPNRVEVLRGAGYIRAVRAGDRVNIHLSGEFLRRFAPAGASLAWFAE